MNTFLPCPNTVFLTLLQEIIVLFTESEPHKDKNFSFSAYHYKVRAPVLLQLHLSQTEDTTEIDSVLRRSNTYSVLHFIITTHVKRSVIKPLRGDSQSHLLITVRKFQHIEKWAFQLLYLQLPCFTKPLHSHNAVSLYGAVICAHMPFHSVTVVVRTWEKNAKPNMQLR